MEKPAIIVCATAYRPFIGGAEIAIEEVARRLGRAFDFYMVTARMSRRLAKREVAPEGTIIRLGFGASFDKWLLPILAPFWFLRSRPWLMRPGLIIWGMDISQGALGAALIKMFFPRLPFVFTVQYGESEERLRRGRVGLIGRGFRAMLARADFVTVISSYLLRIVEEYGYKGPSQIIPNGVDKDAFAEKTWERKRVIITVSRLVQKNGVDILIKAFARARQNIRSLRLIIVGDGPEKANLELLADDLGVGSAITFQGSVAHRDLPEIFSDADGFVRPSRSEGMGNAFVEALGAGVPIIGTMVGGIPDIITDGKTGLFAKTDDVDDLKEKIELMETDDALASGIASRGRAMVEEKFSWDRITRSYADIFNLYTHTKKRITIATGLFPPDIGGPATYSKLLVDELPRAGIGVRIAYFGAVRRLPKIVRHAAYFLRLAFAARGSDVIFAQDPVSVGFPALLAARMLRKHFFLKVVGDYAWEQYVNQEFHPPTFFLKRWVGRRIKNQEFETLEEFQNKRYDIMTECRRFVQKFVARGADVLIVPSEYLGRIVFGWGVSREKIAVVYNAYELPADAPVREEARKKFGLSGMVIISVGRLVPWKGFSMLIDAVADLSLEIPDFCLVIAGSGPDEKRLRRKIKERGIENRVRLVGALAHQEVLSYLAAGDIFVLNSGYEGFSHALLEAMAAGVAVVATRVGGNTEVMSDGKEGILVGYNKKRELMDAIRALHQNPPMRAAMATRAQARAGVFNKQKMIRETVAILI